MWRPGSPPPGGAVPRMPGPALWRCPLQGRSVLVAGQGGGTSCAKGSRDFWVNQSPSPRAGWEDAAGPTLYPIWSPLSPGACSAADGWLWICVQVSLPLVPCWPVWASDRWDGSLGGGGFQSPRFVPSQPSGCHVTLACLHSHFVAGCGSALSLCQGLQEDPFLAFPLPPATLQRTPILSPGIKFRGGREKQHGLPGTTPQSTHPCFVPWQGSQSRERQERERELRGVAGLGGVSTLTTGATGQAQG